MTFSDPGDAIRQMKGAERIRRTARWNGTLLVAASFPVLVIGLGKATGPRDILATFAIFALFFVGGLQLRRRPL